MGDPTKTRAARSSVSSQKRSRGPKLETDVQAQIGTLLQRMYADLLTEPVPDKFAEILRDLPQGGPEDRT